MKPQDAPVLGEWVLATEVAEELGISRQTVSQMFHAGEFKTLTRLNKAEAPKPLFVVKRSELDEVKESRSFPRAKKSEESS